MSGVPFCLDTTQVLKVSLSVKSCKLEKHFALSMSLNESHTDSSFLVLLFLQIFDRHLSLQFFLLKQKIRVDCWLCRKLSLRLSLQKYYLYSGGTGSSEEVPSFNYKFLLLIVIENLSKEWPRLRLQTLKLKFLSLSTIFFQWSTPLNGYNAFWDPWKLI